MTHRGLRTRRLALAGHGAVARALATLLERAGPELAGRYRVAYEVTAVATRSRGLSVPGVGAAGRSAWPGLPAFLADRAAPYDILVEVTTQSPADGEPAATHIRAALESGRDVVTANKAPIAWHEAELRALAARTGARLRYEAALMDCLPTHAIRESIVPVGRVLSFAGVVNATSNAVLSAMAEGRSAADALAGAQRMGLAEADPRNDLEGHDAALKATILANLLLEPRELLRPDAVMRHGLEAVPDEWPAEAVRRGARVRLVARGERGEADAGGGPTGRGAGVAPRAEGGGEAAVGGEAGGRRGTRVRVGPEELPLSDSLALVGGTSMALRIESEYGGRLQFTLLDAPVEETAYAILMDLVALERSGRRD